MGSFRSKMMLSLGLISAQVDLESVLPSTKSQTRLLCADHTVPIKQSWKCDEGDGHYPEEIVRGVETSDGWTVLTTPKPTVDDEKVVDKKSLSMVPLPASEVEANTVVGDAIYYLKPSSTTSNQAWQVFHSIIKKGKVALITKAAFTPNEKMYRLDTFRDYLVLRELVYPEKIADTPVPPAGKVDKNMTALVDQFVDNIMTSWDAFDTTDTNARRLDAWIASGTHVGDKEVPAKPASATAAADLMDVLRQSIEDSKKK